VKVPRQCLLFRWVEACWNDGRILGSEEGKAKRGRKPSGVSTVLGRNFCFGALCCSFEEWEGCLRSLQCNVPTQKLFQYRAKQYVLVAGPSRCILASSPVSDAVLLSKWFYDWHSAIRRVFVLIPFIGTWPGFVSSRLLRFCRQWRRTDGSCTGWKWTQRLSLRAVSGVIHVVAGGNVGDTDTAVIC
jgi:hypothetical protein